MRYAAWIAAVGLTVGLGGGAAAQQTPAQRVDALLSGFQCASLASTVDAAGSVSVAGRVASADDLEKLTASLKEIAGNSVTTDIDIVGRPFCAALEVLGPAIAANEQRSLGARIRPGNDTGVYFEGEPLVLDLTAPSFQSHVYVDYFQLDGKVVHMLPNDKETVTARTAGQHFLIGDPNSGQRAWPIYPPFGREMVTVLAAAQPLFSTPRPEIEESSAYLQALGEALKGQAADQVAAATLDVTSEPKAEAPQPQAQAPAPSTTQPPAKPAQKAEAQPKAKAPTQAARPPQTAEAPAPEKPQQTEAPSPPNARQAETPPKGKTPAPSASSTQQAEAPAPTKSQAPPTTAQAPAKPAQKVEAPPKAKAPTQAAQPAQQAEAQPPAAAKKAAPEPKKAAPAAGGGEQVAIVPVTLTPKKKIGFVQGPNVCKSCHQAEMGVWSGTTHFKDFAEAHKNPKASAILDAAGGEKNMRKNKVCVLCHYTLVQDDENDEGVAKAGPSCESCHGASSKWLDVHNKKGVAHDQRMAEARTDGMITSEMHYDIAENCMSCHGLANPNLDPNVMGKMLEAGHPVSPEFELVRYSQGSVRHRYFPPDTDKNKTMSPAELARLFVTGQAAKLVSAEWAAGRSNVPKYKEVQLERAKLAGQALSAGRSMPEIAAFLKAPSEGAAHKLVEAINGKDMSAQFGAQLPKDYK
jgi:hypothetical protein